MISLKLLYHQQLCILWLFTFTSNIVVIYKQQQKELFTTENKMFVTEDPTSKDLNYRLDFYKENEKNRKKQHQFARIFTFRLQLCE